MSDINANMVKELREKTGAGMMDCKKALVETKGDMEAAIDWLRKKGLSAAAKKAGRVAAEGLVAVSAKGNKAVVVEVNSETDFVARNEKFQEFASNLANLALASGAGINEINELIYPATGRKVVDELANMIATIGENMTIRRISHLSVTQGIVSSYVHNSLAPSLGKIGVLVALESSADAAKLTELGKQLAMHIAAARPDALTIQDIDPKALERERNIIAEQARASGKPENIVEKMVEGRLRKYYEEVVLLEQLYVIDNETRVKQVLEKFSKELGTPVRVTGFVRFQLGEGIEKPQECDFAAEVAKMAG